MNELDQEFLRQAVLQAKKAQQSDEVPVGAVIVIDGQIIAEGFNQTRTVKSPIEHAEIVALKMACSTLSTYRLDEATIYISLEPCMMCLGAIINAKVKRIVYGAIESKSGMLGGIVNLLALQNLTHYPQVTYLPNEDCQLILTEFFKKKRGSHDI